MGEKEEDNSSSYGKKRKIMVVHRGKRGRK
jgi:hypothetical protein